MALAPTGQSHEMNESKRRAESSKARQSCDCDRSSEDLTVASLFRDLWRKATDDNHLTLYGFRRFRTTHLLNLRYLEEEIDVIDHRIFQAGLRLGHVPPSPSPDKLGLRHGRIDTSALGHGEVMDRELVLRMRELIKQYGMLNFAGKTRSVCWLIGFMCCRRGFSLL